MAISLPKKNEEGKSLFSYSQYSKWKYDRKEYFKSYFFGDRFEGNAYTEFGTMVGEALENNNFESFTEKEKQLLSKVTRLDEFERKIEFDLGEFIVLGYLDTNDNKKNIVTKIVDYKTGDLNKEEVYKDNKYDQVTIYAGAIEQETGHLPKEGWVELIERKGNAFRGEELKLGDHVIKIPQDVSKKAVDKVKKNLIKEAKDVSAHFKVFNILNSIEEY